MAGLCVPGDLLGTVEEFESGTGTYVRAGSVYAAVVGTRLQTEGSSSLPRLEVASRSRGTSSAVPAVGDVVTARVVRLAPRQAQVQILCLGEAALDRPYSGVVRTQDVRLTDVDSVSLAACFRPGDLIRAEVLSLGDARSYYLSTAGNHLGVVHALSLAGGAPMQPLSWEEMQCSLTKSVEKRKVAKV